MDVEIIILLGMTFITVVVLLIAVVLLFTGNSKR